MNEPPPTPVPSKTGIPALTRLHDAILDLCGHRDGAEATADGSADNDLAHERTDAIMQFIIVASTHPNPHKLLTPTTQLINPPIYTSRRGHLRTSGWTRTRQHEPHETNTTP
jgi:hypothetical protein